MIKGNFLLGYCFSYNRLGHKVIECRNGMNQNVRSLSEQCFTCKKFGHKASQCKTQILNNYGRITSFSGHCYVCNDFGHKTNLCRSRINKGNSGKRNDKYYNCNKFGHLAKFCRNKKDNPMKRHESTKKVNVEEVKRVMKNI